MTFLPRITVNTNYTRSTNVERDKNSREIIESYLPTSRGLGLLGQVSGALNDSDQPRAWSLIGPYGSGKSSFALFLNQLLSGAGDEIGDLAGSVLGKEDPALASAFRQQSGWCRVALTGSAEPLSNRLVFALADAAQDFWALKKGRKPQIVRELERAKSHPQTNNDVLHLVDELQSALMKMNSGGLVIVIDELGKFLEFESRQYGANDIYLLQGLAEKTYTGGSTNLMLFVLLHQSFDLYARGLGENLKNEWAKVQGRFQTVPFIENTEQTLRIVSAALDNDFNGSEKTKIDKKASTIAKKWAAQKNLPGLLDAASAGELFASGYPLHPLSLMILPALCQKFAQNERTLFSYLGSQEPHGFQNSLLDLRNAGEWITPDRIYDYFIQNQPAVLADPLTHRRWAEVVTAVDRAEELGGAQLKLAKTIGVLNLVSGMEGIRASEIVLSTIFKSKSEFQMSVSKLAKASIVQFRQFSGEYRVWQGTDFNIDEEVHKEREKLGRFDLAAKLSERFESLPILARRHSLDHGALRYFQVEYTDAAKLKSVEKKNYPRVIFFLAEGQDDEKLFESQLNRDVSSEIWVLYRNGEDIRSAIQEFLSLEAVQRGGQALASDPIAARELKERIKAAALAEESILSNLTEKPAASGWFWDGKNTQISNSRELQSLLSNVMDQIYHCSPVIQNELINRDKISGQAAAARNKLFQLMLTEGQKVGLGIEKYPPEKAIYRSIFELGLLHVEDKGQASWASPGKKDPLRLAPLWKKFDDFFASTEEGRRPVDELIEEVSEPPFGLKRGSFPLLFLHYYFLNKAEIAVYEDGLYMPDLTYEHIERMTSKPSAFSFQRFRIDGLRATLFEEYAKALFGVAQKVDVLGIARPLTSFMFDLPDFVKKTRRLNSSTIKVRDAFFLSKSPERLLFSEIPGAFGYEEGADISGLSDQLIQSLRELKGAYEHLLSELHDDLCEVFNLPKSSSLGELREILRGRSHGLDNYTVDVKGLKAFIRRIVEKQSSDEEWLTALFLFLGRNPVSKWTDQDKDAAEYRLSEFARRLLDLEKLRQHDQRSMSAEGDLDIILLKSLQKGGEEIDEIVSLGQNTKKAIAQSREKIRSAIEELGDNELRLALVADIAHEFLSEYRAASSRSREAIEEDDVDAAG